MQCAPPMKVIIQKASGPSSLQSRSGVSPSACVPTPIHIPKSTHASSSRIGRLPPPTAPPTRLSFPRFGSTTACPGCHLSVSPMERGVVLGPQGTRWHASCLVCGGKKEATKNWRGKEEKKGEPGCGKQLDSAAKSGGDGEVWCRECLVRMFVFHNTSKHSLRSASSWVKGVYRSIPNTYTSRAFIHRIRKSHTTIHRYHHCQTVYWSKWK